MLAAPGELSDDRRLGGRRREIGAVGLGGGTLDMPFRGSAGVSPAAASVRRNSTQRRENDYTRTCQIEIGEIGERTNFGFVWLLVVKFSRGCCIG